MNNVKKICCPACGRLGVAGHPVIGMRSSRWGGSVVIVADEPGPLCLRCEVKYQVYLALYRTDGGRRMSKPQTRHQWAASSKNGRT